MYRYRLADVPENEGCSACVLEGVRILRRAWYNSPERIDFKALSSLVVEEEAPSLEEFDRRDLATRTVVPSAPPAPVETKARSSSPRASPLVAQLKRRGFSDAELAGRGGAELQELLAFDRAISRRS
jgi:hypothetical protein